MDKITSSDLNIGGFLVETMLSTKQVRVYKVVGLTDTEVSFESDFTREVFQHPRYDLDYLFMENDHMKYRYARTETELLHLKLIS